MGEHDHQDSAADPEPVTRLAQSPEPETGSKQSQCQHDKPESRTPWGMDRRLELLFTAVIALATVVYSAVSYHQWDATMLSLNYTRQSVELAAEALKQAARANKESGETTKKSLDIADRAFKETQRANREMARLNQRSLDETRRSNNLTQRAWIIIPEIENLVFEANRKLVVTIRLKNVGHIPAVRVGGAMAPHFILTGANIPKLGVPTEPERSTAVIGPGEQSRIELDIGTFSEADKADILAGRKILAVNGRVTYTDPIGTSGDTAHCAIYYPRLGRNFVFCADGNDVK